MLEDIAVIGSDDFCLGFKLAGVKETIVTEDDYEEKIEELYESDYGIVITDHNDFQELSKSLRRKLKVSVSPIFVTLSSESGDEALESKIKEAIGVDLLGD